MLLRGILRDVIFSFVASAAHARIRCEICASEMINSVYPEIYNSNPDLPLTGSSEISNCFFDILAWMSHSTPKLSTPQTTLIMPPTPSPAPPPLNLPCY